MNHIGEQQHGGDKQPSSSDPEAVICEVCGKVAPPVKNIGKGILEAVGVVLIVPVINLLFGAIWGPEFLHDNSKFLTIMFIVTLGAAGQIVRAAMKGSCSSGGVAGVFPLSSSEGQHLISKRKWVACPQCRKTIRLNVDILKDKAGDSNKCSESCPYCKELLIVDMGSFEIK